MVVGSGLADPAPDFNTEILPIFQRHCFECHGNGKRQGELNLQTLAGVRLGGHSGSPLLADELNQSELYLRVTSTTDGYRMPKSGEPLSADELEILTAWIRATPPTEADDRSQTDSAASSALISGDKSGQNESSQPESGFPWLDALTPGQRYQAIGVSIAIVLLLLYLVVRAVQTRNKKLRETPSGVEVKGSSLLGWALRVFVGAILCVAVVGFGYYYFVADQLSQQVEDLTATVARLQPKKAPAKPIGPQHLPLPPSPMHPQRLGGRYYRGNDERDSALYNGGFYRTATIDLRLIDAMEDPVKWGDAVSGELSIEITIDRAPQATRELFTDRVREAVSLQHYNLPNQVDGDESTFGVVEAEQRWQAKIALPKTDSWKNGRTAGMIYMMYGVDHAVKTKAGSSSPRPHFGIRYEINVVHGEISQASTLWMGSMYTLGGRVLVPSKEQVLLDRWFDWRPIPVIEGEGSSDPKLLGLPEHTRSSD